MTLPVDPKTDQRITWIKNVDLEPYWQGEHTYSLARGHVIRLRPHASTSTKVHELQHAQLGHMGAKTYGDVLIHEYQAYKGTAEIMGPKKLDNYLWHGLIPQMVEDTIRQGNRPNTVYNFLVKTLEKQGYRFTDHDRHALWQYIREKYKERQK